MGAKDSGNAIMSKRISYKEQQKNNTLDKYTLRATCRFCHKKLEKGICVNKDCIEIN